MPDQGLHQLLQRANSGDAVARERAFAELLRLVTVFVRAGMSHRLRDHRESLDVSQSIARSFVEDHRDGSVQFDSEAAVVGYLKTVVQSKLAMLARHDGALKRGGDQRPLTLNEHDSSGDLHPDAATPPREDARLREQEALLIVHERLTPEDLEIARLRLCGLDWNQIAERLAIDSQTLRKRWSRLSATLAGEITGAELDGKQSTPNEPGDV